MENYNTVPMDTTHAGDTTHECMSSKASFTLTRIFAANYLRKYSRSDFGLLVYTDTNTNIRGDRSCECLLSFVL